MYEIHRMRLSEIAKVDVTALYRCTYNIRQWYCSNEKWHVAPPPPGRCVARNRFSRWKMLVRNLTLVSSSADHLYTLYYMSCTVYRECLYTYTCIWMLPRQGWVSGAGAGWLMFGSGGDRSTTATATAVYYYKYIHNILINYYKVALQTQVFYIWCTPTSE